MESTSRNCMVIPDHSLILSDAAARDLFTAIQKLAIELFDYIFFDYLEKQFQLPHLQSNKFCMLELTMSNLLNDRQKYLLLAAGVPCDFINTDPRFAGQDTICLIAMKRPDTRDQKFFYLVATKSTIEGVIVEMFANKENESFADIHANENEYCRLLYTGHNDLQQTCQKIPDSGIKAFAAISMFVGLSNRDMMMKFVKICKDTATDYIRNICLQHLSGTLSPESLSEGVELAVKNKLLEIKKNIEIFCNVFPPAASEIGMVREGLNPEVMIAVVGDALACYSRSHGNFIPMVAMIMNSMNRLTNLYNDEISPSLAVPQAVEHRLPPASRMRPIPATNHPASLADVIYPTLLSDITHLTQFHGDPQRPARRRRLVNAQRPRPYNVHRDTQRPR